MKQYIFAVADGIQVQIKAKTFQEAHAEYEKVKVEVAAEKVKIVHKPIVKMERHSLRNHIMQLKGQSFFDTPRTLRDIKEKLAELAVHYPITSMPSYLNPLVRDGILKRTRGKREEKEMWFYENGG